MDILTRIHEAVRAVGYTPQQAADAVPFTLDSGYGVDIQPAEEGGYFYVIGMQNWSYAAGPEYDEVEWGAFPSLFELLSYLRWRDTVECIRQDKYERQIEEAAAHMEDEQPDAFSYMHSIDKEQGNI